MFWKAAELTRDINLNPNSNSPIRTPSHLPRIAQLRSFDRPGNTSQYAQGIWK